MNTLNYEYHLKIDIDAAWSLWSNFQEIDRFSPAKITGGTNTDEIGAVRIYEIDGREPARVGGERIMRRFSTGSALSLQILKEFIFWNY